MTDLHYDMRNKLADNMHCMKDDVAMHLREDDPHLYMKDKLDDGKGHRKLRRKDNLMNPQALSPPIQPGAFLVSARIIFFIFFYSPSLRHALFASDNIFFLPSIFTTLFLFSSFIFLSSPESLQRQVLLKRLAWVPVPLVMTVQSESMVRLLLL